TRQMGCSVRCVKESAGLRYLFAAAGWMLAAHVANSVMQLLGVTGAWSWAHAAMLIFWTTPDQSISLRSRAIGIAVINATGNMGSAMSPLLFGWLKDLTGSFNAGFYLVAGFLVLGALVVWRIPMKASRPRATP
ncbi:4-hydroxyphenylacetate permease, partial [Serratia marcescens]